MFNDLQVNDGFKCSYSNINMYIERNIFRILQNTWLNQKKWNKFCKNDSISHVSLFQEVLSIKASVKGLWNDRCSAISTKKDAFQAADIHPILSRISFCFSSSSRASRVRKRFSIRVRPQRSRTKKQHGQKTMVPSAETRESIDVGWRR